MKTKTKKTQRKEEADKVHFCKECRHFITKKNPESYKCEYLDKDLNWYNRVCDNKFEPSSHAEFKQP